MNNQNNSSALKTIICPTCCQGQISADRVQGGLTDEQIIQIKTECGWRYNSLWDLSDSGACEFARAILSRQSMMGRYIESSIALDSATDNLYGQNTRTPSNAAAANVVGAADGFGPTKDGCCGVTVTERCNGCPYESADVVDADGQKPIDCSGDPSNCPDNEGYGCHCGYGAAAKTDADRLDALEKFILTDGHMYLHDNKARADLCGLHIGGVGGLRTALDGLIERRAPTHQPAPQTSGKEGEAQ